ncbi:MAG: hypothetical protein QOG04_671 [Actinomycetota bacterium]|nr:hypothetical protein [Actinomycetota bacterium]
MKKTLLASGAVLALTVLHDLDHMRQGRDLPTAVSLVGLVATVAAIGFFVWVWRDGETARRAAGAWGVAVALGLIAIHVLPDWGPVSDPFSAADVDALSWISLIALMASGVWLAIAGLKQTP